MSEQISFWVDGEPAPQGSKIRNRYGGLREDNPKTAPWRGVVSWKAHEAMRGHELIEGAVSVELFFQFARPISHFGTGRNAGRLRPSAPVWHQSKPDVDKLSRAILDSITGVVIRDDCRVVELSARKAYGNPGAKITVKSL